MKKGFTLIELLVVVAIIGVLASVVLASLNTARVKGRDARRLADLKQIQTALEMYFNDFGYYPARDQAYTTSASCGGVVNWCGLVTDLAPYLSVVGDPLGHQDSYRYWYDTDSGDNYQTYGFMITFEYSGNYNKGLSDGGGYGTPYYEIGQQPSYCVSKYTGSDALWLWTPTTVCVGGN